MTATGLQARLLDDIDATGPMPFEAFMERALYDPNGGFFGSGPLRSVKSGDFLTSPEVSPWFGRCLGRFVAAEWRRLGQPDPILVIDAEKHVILAANRQATETYGYDTDAMIDLPFAKLVVDPPDVDRLFDESAADEPQPVESLHRTRNGRTLIIDALGSRVRYQDRDAVLADPVAAAGGRVGRHEPVAGVVLEGHERRTAVGAGEDLEEIRGQLGFHARLIGCAVGLIRHTSRL